MTESTGLEYVGFWARVWASFIDSVLLLIVMAPLARIFFGSGQFSYDLESSTQNIGEFLMQIVLPAIVVIVFWTTRHATPGKMMIGATIVDAKTGGPPSLGQHVIRYIGYFISAFFLCLGFIWIAFDRKKQGWHDKMAGTVVVRASNRETESVQFEK